jgi:acyl-CoA dehydrogenase
MALPLDPHLEERHRELADRVRDLGERHLDGTAGVEENPSERAAEVVSRLGEAGLLSHAVPPPFGAFDSRSALVVREGLAYFSLLAEAAFSAQALAAHVLAAAGSDVQRGRWLPALADGTAAGALAATEPDAGSDLAAVRTLAEVDGPLFRLSGVKTWVTAARGARVYVTLARSGDEEGARGVSLFLVDGGAPGLEVRPLETMAALPLQDLRLDGTPAVLLGEEGQGVRLVQRAVEAARPGAAGAACGLAARALEPWPASRPRRWPSPTCTPSSRPPGGWRCTPRGWPTRGGRRPRASRPRPAWWPPRPPAGWSTAPSSFTGPWGS